MKVRNTYGLARAVKFLTAYEDQGDNDTLEIPEDLTALDDEALGALSTQATEAFQALYQGGQADLGEQDLEALAALADGIEALAAEAATREQAATARREAAAALAARVNPTGEDAGEGDDGDGEGDDAGEGEDAGEGDGDGEGDDAGDGEGDDEENPDEAVTASGRRTTRVNLRGLRSQQRAPRSPGNSTPPAERTLRDIVMAAPDVPGFSTGQGMDMLDMGRAVDSRLQAFNLSTFEAARRQGKHVRQQFGVATIHKDFEDGLKIVSNDPAHIEQVFDYAMDDSRLPGGSLVASGGWCAPSETVYDLFETESRDGLLSLPEVNISRGGINFTPGPDFGEIFRSTGFCFTEEDDILGDYDGEGGPKPCFHVPCPDFDEERLQVCGVCITAGLLQRRGYPEIIARTVRGALVAHAHRLSGTKINSLVAGSTAITMPADQVGALAPLLTTIELQVEHYRHVHRLSRNTSLEAVFPFWTRGVVRSDLSRRLGVDLLSVPDARIDGWFRERGVNPQFVYNWQDIATTAASGFTAWPTEVDFLLYQAGTWVAGGGDVITLDTVYDSQMLGKNDYTALFTEESWLTAKRGHDSRVITVPVCATGDTGGGVLIDCDGSAGAAA